MTMGEDDFPAPLLCKPEVFLYKIESSIQKKKGYLHRASDWNIESPDWHGKIQLLASGPSCIIQLEDKRGDIFAKGIINSYPGGDDLKAVLDSTRYFTVRLQTISGENELFGMGFTSRCDSGDLNRALKDYFASARKKRVSENDDDDDIKSVPPPIKKTKTEELELESKPDEEIIKETVVQNDTLPNSKSVLTVPAQQNKVVASPVQQKLVTVEQQKKVVTATPVQKVATVEQKQKATPTSTTPIKSTTVKTPAQQKSSPVKTKVATPQKATNLKTVNAVTSPAKSANVPTTKAAKPIATVSPQDKIKVCSVEPAATPAVASGTCKAPSSSPTLPPPLSTPPQPRREQPRLRSILKNKQSASSSPLLTVNPAPVLPTSIVKVATTVIKGSTNSAASLVPYDSERSSPIPTELVSYAIESEESMKQDEEKNGGSTTKEVSTVNNIEEKLGTIPPSLNNAAKSPSLNPTVSLLRMPASTQLTSPAKGKSIFIVKTTNNVITPGATIETQPAPTVKTAVVPNPLFKSAVETVTEPVVKSNKAPIANLSRVGAAKPPLVPTPVAVELAAPPITPQPLQVTRQGQEDIELIDLDSEGDNSKDAEGGEGGEEEGNGEDQEMTEETEQEQECEEGGQGVEGESEDFCDAEAGEEGEQEEAGEEYFDEAAEGDEQVVDSEMDVRGEEVVEDEIGIDHVEGDEEIQTEEKEAAEEFIGVDPTDEDYFREQILEGEQETNDLDDIDTSELIVPETGEELDPATVVVELNDGI